MQDNVTSTKNFCKELISVYVLNLKTAVEKCCDWQCGGGSGCEEQEAAWGSDSGQCVIGGVVVIQAVKSQQWSVCDWGCGGGYQVVSVWLGEWWWFRLWRASSGQCVTGGVVVVIKWSVCDWGCGGGYIKWSVCDWGCGGGYQVVGVWLGEWWWFRLWRASSGQCVTGGVVVVIKWSVCDWGCGGGYIKWSVCDWGCGGGYQVVGVWLGEWLWFRLWRASSGQCVTGGVVVVQAVKSQQWSVCDWGCGGGSGCEEPAVVSVWLGVWWWLSSGQFVTGGVVVVLAVKSRKR